ncbi:MAG: SHOCT-like domain-containing protein, partial [Vicinamibacterales bacterium]
SAGGEPKPTPRWLRIVVDKEIVGGRKKQVSVRVPVSLVRAGVRLGGMMPGVVAGRAGGRLDAMGLGDLGFDFSKIDPKQLEAVINDMGEMVIDVDSGRAQVRINCE